MLHLAQKLLMNFDQLEKAYEEIGDLPAGNVFNYDETNLCDDPGKKVGNSAPWSP